MGKIKVLILGANGMLGHKLFLHLSQYEDLNVKATVRNPEVLANILTTELMKGIVNNVDAANFTSIIETIRDFKPDWVINCIGIVKQGLLALNPVVSISINALLPHKIAQVCAIHNARFLHISTDCVFSGNRGYYNEADPSDALDLYGKTKFLGEVSYPHCITLRTSIIGHELQSKLGLIEWFLSQANSVQGYKRHIFSGFPTIELARFIAQYIIPGQGLAGMYHLSSEPISKFELLQMVAAKYQHSTIIIPDEQTFCDRSLDSSELRRMIAYSLPSWPEMIDAMYEDYINTPYPGGKT